MSNFFSKLFGQNTQKKSEDAPGDISEKAISETTSFTGSFESIEKHIINLIPSDQPLSNIPEANVLFGIATEFQNRISKELSVEIAARENEIKKIVNAGNQMEAMKKSIFLAKYLSCNDHLLKAEEAAKNKNTEETILRIAEDAAVYLYKDLNRFALAVHEYAIVIALGSMNLRHWTSMAFCLCSTELFSPNTKSIAAEFFIHCARATLTGMVMGNINPKNGMGWMEERILFAGKIYPDAVIENEELVGMLAKLTMGTYTIDSLKEKIDRIVDEKKEITHPQNEIEWLAYTNQHYPKCF